MMGRIEIHSQPLSVRFKASICSKATVFWVFCSLLTFLPPLFISYSSQGFWKEIDFYREQPEIHFKHKVLIVLETKSPEKAIVWSTFPRLNKYLKSYVKSRIPAIEHLELDIDRNGKNDKLEMTIHVPVTEEVNSVKMLLFFDYKLHALSALQMEGLAYFQYSSALAGGSLDIFADLGFHQREPLWHNGEDTRFNYPIIDESSEDLSTYKLENILKSYSERNVSTIVKNPHFVWLSGRNIDDPFTIIVNLLYPETTIQYRTGFWQVLKWAWVQYLAILIIFWYILSSVKKLVIEKGLMPIVSISDVAKNL